MVQSQEPAETRPTSRSNFPESKIAFSRQNQLGTKYFGALTAQQRDHMSTPCGDHTITHFRGTITHNLLTYNTSEISSNTVKFRK